MKLLAQCDKCGIQAKAVPINPGTDGSTVWILPEGWTCFQVNGSDLQLCDTDTAHWNAASADNVKAFLTPTPS